MICPMVLLLPRPRGASNTANLISEDPLGVLVYVLLGKEEITTIL